MFLDTVGKDLYNKGVQEASDYVRDRNEQILLDLEALLKKS
jgi:uncharacterized protein (DUF2164 family)